MLLPPFPRNPASWGDREGDAHRGRTAGTRPSSAWLPGPAPSASGLLACRCRLWGQFISSWKGRAGLSLQAGAPSPAPQGPGLLEKPLPQRCPSSG